MKIRILTGAAVLCAAVLLCGCEGKIPFPAAKTPELSPAWTAQAEIKFGDNTANAEVSRIEPGCWEFSFTEPQELCGVKMTLENGALTASLGELTVTAGDGDNTILPQLIAAGIDAAAESTTGASEKDGVLTIKTETDGSSCTVTADSASGEILSFRSPANKLAVYFSEVSPYTEEIGVIE